ncbi:hypothetical protein V8C86DRAFT_2727436 [Haematococcus lacustris]
MYMQGAPLQAQQQQPVPSPMMLAMPSNGVTGPAASSNMGTSAMQPMQTMQAPATMQAMTTNLASHPGQQALSTLPTALAPTAGAPGAPGAGVSQLPPLPPSATALLVFEGLPADLATREAAHIFRPIQGYKVSATRGHCWHGSPGLHLSDSAF